MCNVKGSDIVDIHEQEKILSIDDFIKCYSLVQSGNNTITVPLIPHSSSVKLNR
jgi:hypothetical protein